MIYPAFRVTKDGREICYNGHKHGRDEYRRRIEIMRVRQGGICCLSTEAPMCPGRLFPGEATFEHQDGRGMGGSHRDDRIEKDGRPYNGSAHWQCNQWKGSRHIDYNFFLETQNAASGE